MSNGFLEALKRIFVPVERNDNESQAPQSSQESQPSQKIKVDEATHVVQLLEEVVEQLIKQLQALHGMESKVQGLTLWTTDTVTAQALKDKEFLKLLRLRLDDAGFEQTELSGQEISLQEPPTGARQLPHGVSFTLGDETKKNGPVARITLSEVAGHGTLAQPCYILDTSDKTEFRLGRGKQGSHDSLWTNDVVIRDDDSDEVMRNFNGFVSSQQALIIARDGRFYLRATPSGCRDTGGCATKIISNDEVRELSDTSRLHLLHDGDTIELGKRVRIAVNLA